MYILWVIVSDLSEFENYDELEIQVDQRRIVVRCDLTSRTLGGTGLGRLGLRRVKFVIDGPGIEKNQPAHLPLPLATTPSTTTDRVGTIDTPANRDGDEFHS